MEKGVAGLAGWLHEHKITVYMSSASVFRHLMKTLKGGERFPRMRIVRLGSEPVTSDDFRAFQEHFADGCTLIIALSSSETGSVTQLRLGRNARVDPGRLPVGRPVEGVELLLLDEDGREVAQGETGEMVIRSRYLSPGYWRNPQLTAQRFAGNGALRTFSSGDLACIASDGLFRFMGARTLGSRSGAIASSPRRSRKPSWPNPACGERWFAPIFDRPTMPCSLRMSPRAGRRTRLPNRFETPFGRRFRCT